MQAGFCLTFKKLFVSFSKENNCAKLILNTTHHGWVIKNIFHCGSLKTAINRIFLPFHPTEKHQICILYQKTFLKKECFKIPCKKSFENILT